MAGNGQVKADLDVLGGVSSKMAGNYEQLEEAISKLRGEAATHSASWSGQARNAWQVAMDDVNSAWAQLNGVLNEISGNIQTSGAQYDSTDSANAQSHGQVETTGITSALIR
ncbi:WXG100 family type VII secretion target [Kineosporia babensis]|uniref:WXG100 family type VII secretion target n=1 Tax=Kineosporia babensis TaxID=499548 RepID=A0A9X1N9E6_9ACTN|nr:WXG100 family type VII secretion target [Kineosporia babensis]MCD5309995.1 WXG100 family type VII secretion target [Kineosporia babensis]